MTSTTLTKSIASAVLLALLALAGCNDLPAPDKRLTTPCGAGSAKPGDDARVAAKRKEAARACEAGRADAWVDFYAGLRANRAEARR